MTPIHIPNWVMHPELWRFVSFASCVIGLLCYALSSSFNHLFGEWNLYKILFYSVVCFIICSATLLAKSWQFSTGLLFKAHLAVLVLTVTSVYSFFYDKAFNGKPDALSLISCAAFALMLLSLSRQTHLGFEVDLLYFFLGFLIVQLMKIKFLLGLVGAAFSYSLMLLRSSLDSQLQNGNLGLQQHVVIQMDTSSNGIVLVDTRQPGDALVMHKLMACAEALQEDNLNLAETLAKEIGMLAASQAGGLTKVESYLTEALIRRIHGMYSQEALDSPFSDKLYMHFYESFPYLKFAHVTANQAILEAFASANHVIDLGLKQGMQWPALMHAMALRPGGPPTVRLTGIGPPQRDKTDALQFVGWRLEQAAKSISVEFEFRGIVCNSLEDVEPSALEIRPGEAVAVNSIFELHRTLARKGAIERVLNTIKSVKPNIVAMVEQDANHNGPTFLERFTEAFNYYSNVFNSVEELPCEGPPCEAMAMTEMYLGRELCNVVGCEGEDRVERHETLSQWSGRMASAGFQPVHLSPNVIRHANLLLGLLAGDGYKVQDKNGCAVLGQHSRPLFATFAWKIR